MTDGVLDMTTLDRMLPHADTPIATPDAIVDGARYKTMAGLLLQLGAFAEATRT